MLKSRCPKYTPQPAEGGKINACKSTNHFERGITATYRVRIDYILKTYRPPTDTKRFKPDPIRTVWRKRAIHRPRAEAKLHSDDISDTSRVPTPYRHEPTEHRSHVSDNKPGHELYTDPMPNAYRLRPSTNRPVFQANERGRPLGFGKKNDSSLRFSSPNTWWKEALKREQEKIKKITLDGNKL